MGELVKETLPVDIEDELRQFYLDYAASVIVRRALPDARDGLKSVYRRVLYTTSELGNDWNKPYKKPTHVIGDVIGEYHPYGDTAVYDAIVRMMQPFSLRYTLVNDQGNFGSMDGDNAAAMRYTEVRMAELAHELLADLKEETVDQVPNYDGTEQIPMVMPTKTPDLLVNDPNGIAVGIATGIPPHSLGEMIDNCLAPMDNSDLTVDEPMQYIPGPDFPTASIINGRVGIIRAYRTGRGRIYTHAHAVVEEVEKGGGCEQIIIIELSYRLNKARLIEKTAELVKEKKIEGVSELRSESDRDGMCVVIELRRGEMGEAVLNNLYTQTRLQSVFGINVVALVNGQLCILNLKDMLEVFVHHRRETVTRHTVYELHRARERGHILEGQAVALSSIDPVTELVKNSPTLAEVKKRLIATIWESSAVEVTVECTGADACHPEDLGSQYSLRDGKYYLSPEQAQAILKLCLHRLTGLEYEKLFSEYQKALNLIGKLIRILTNPAHLTGVIRKELETVKVEFDNARRTETVASQVDLTIADLITEEGRVVTISHGGYAEFQPLVTYQTQRRGSKDRSATGMKNEDYIEHLLMVNNHATLPLFSSKNKTCWLHTFKIPEALRTTRGQPLVNLLPLDEGERITAMLQIGLEALQQNGGVGDDPDEAEGAVLEGEVVEAVEVEEVEDETAGLVAEPAGAYIFMIIAFGTVKETPLVQPNRPRSSGLIALKLGEGDTLIAAAIIDGAKEIMLLSSTGRVVHFAESVVCIMGRNARGVHGMCLGKGQQLISMLILEFGAQILTTSGRGSDKRTPLSKSPRRGRGDQGMVAMVTNECSGALIAAVQVQEGEKIMLISDQGTLVRARVDEISLSGRNTQGVILTKLTSDEVLVGLERVQGPSGRDDEDLPESEEAAESLGKSAESGSEPTAEAEGNEE